MDAVRENHPAGDIHRRGVALLPADVSYDFRERVS